MATERTLTIIKPDAVAAGHVGDIIKIFEVQRQGSCPYFSMEFVEGGSLARHLAGRPQPDHGATTQLVETLGCPVLAHPEDPMPVRADALGEGDRLMVGSA